MNGDKMNSKFCVLVSIIICLLLLTSCSSPYIGKYVSMNQHNVCEIKGYPASCSVVYDEMSINYQVEETKNPGEYQISGTGVFTGGTLWRTFSLRVELLIIQDGVVVEVISISGGMGTTNSDATFSRTFLFPGKIQATIITGRIALQD